MSKNDLELSPLELYEILKDRPNKDLMGAARRYCRSNPEEAAERIMELAKADAVMEFRLSLPSSATTVKRRT